MTRVFLHPCVAEMIIYKLTILHDCIHHWCWADMRAIWCACRGMAAASAGSWVCTALFVYSDRVSAGGAWVFEELLSLRMWRPVE